MIKKYKEYYPRIGKNTFIAENATIIGNVEIGQGCSILYGAVIRSEGTLIKICDGSNIQDNVIIHVTPGLPVTVGENVTVGHGAILHSTTIGSGCLIGMGSILLNGSFIGKNSFIGAGSLINERAVIPEGHLAVGSPAKVLGKLTERPKTVMTKANKNYDIYLKELLKQTKEE